MTVRSACSAWRRLSSSAFLLATAAALALPASTDPEAGALPLLLAMDDDEADCALSFTDLPVLSRTACAARAPTRLMYLKLMILFLLLLGFCLWIQLRLTWMDGAPRGGRVFYTARGREGTAAPPAVVLLLVSVSGGRARNAVLFGTARVI
ncbi:hypothetical protein U9M48_033993 [Paspalum notatum var. saurae]|uniref:Uncharacterized protein n=1 Tax=Paspalum notatum var. saurae TaxID=547442 RepID=A0AAQ3U8R4_PASNO